jgi:uncharacterized protein (TIGR02145 family)
MSIKYLNIKNFILKIMRPRYSDLIKIAIAILFVFQISCEKETPLRLTDKDGNHYNTIIIGNQEWMSENLRVTHYQDGSKIPNIKEDNTWKNLTYGAMCWPDNDSITKRTEYGGLYNWNSIIDNRKLCPVGWHIPTDQDWTVLSEYLGEDQTAGGKMKEAGTAHWVIISLGADNSSGFTALPGGLRNPNGLFAALGSYAYFWSKTENDATTSWVRSIGYGSDKLFKLTSPKINGLSVRCLKD